MASTEECQVIGCHTTDKCDELFQKGIVSNNLALLPPEDHGICKRKADPNYAFDNTPDTKRIQASECMNDEDWFEDGFCAPEDNCDRLYEFFNNDDGYRLLTWIGIYLSKKQPNEQLEKLRADHHLNSLLKETESIRITRVVLSVLFGYWSDDAFNENVHRAITSHRKKSEPPPPTGPTFTRSETVVGIDYPASVEGLKEVFMTRYPVDEAKIICEEIDRLTYIPDFFSTGECRRIKWLMFSLGKNKLCVHMVGFSDYEGSIW